jgi:hypothetical protein
VEDNPYAVLLGNQIRNFQADTRYYNCTDPVELVAAYEVLKTGGFEVKHLRSFQELLIRRYLADTYHVNSYVQESLVEICGTVDEMIRLFQHPTEAELPFSVTAHELFYRLSDFELRLEESMQRGSVRWGFMKKRKFIHWDILVVGRYLCSVFCCFNQIPIQNELLSILQDIRRLSEEYDSQVLRREIRDFETLYWASRESGIASLIFTSASLTFLASLVFTIGRIFSIGVQNSIAFFSAATSALGALLAVMHFVRKLFILGHLWMVLGAKKHRVSQENQKNFGRIRTVTCTQILLTLSRLIAACAAALAFPFSVAENGYGDKISTPKNLPFWIAFIAVVMAIGSTVFFFVVEYVVRYTLSPELGPFVCKIFKHEIENLHATMSVSLNNMDSKEVQEREAWDYTAREFLHRWRFDTVFAADRFGMIFQYVKSGMTSPVKAVRALPA